ncbi:MAG: PPC domain-containing protein [Candidatus Marinimicrobia bacterium]|nr:PPC domain-containing protein [Candidatus Neomarinimicrobiota bacterium]
MQLIKSKLLFIFTIIVAFVLITSCEDKKDDAAPGEDLYGVWSVESESFSLTFGGVTFEESTDYSNRLVLEKMFVEFEKASLTTCENDICSSTHSCEASTITYEDGKISTEMDGEPMEMEYTISNNTLTMNESYTDTDGSFEGTIVLKKYSGTFPPSEWDVAYTGDGFEPDNNISQANPITIGDTGQDHDLYCDDDFVSFDADSGTSYIIDIDSEFDSYLNLYNSDGTYISSNDDAWPYYDGNNELDATLEWDCELDGTYYVEIVDFWDESDGTYNITVEVGTGLARIGAKISELKNKQRIPHFSRLFK